jgi:hypothetical protein
VAVLTDIVEQPSSIQLVEAVLDQRFVGRHPGVIGEGLRQHRDRPGAVGQSEDHCGRAVEAVRLLGGEVVDDDVVGDFLDQEILDTRPGIRSGHDGLLAGSTWTAGAG